MAIIYHNKVIKMSEKREEEINFNEILEALKTIMGKGKEEALAEAIETLGSSDKIMMFSDVSKREIPYISTMKVIAKRYQVKWLDDYIDFDLLLRVSDKRRGRTELVKVIAGIKKGIEERAKSIFKRGVENNA